MTKLKALIAPSLLAGDWGILADECNRMVDLGADYLHMDVMDGHFVPNLTMGAPILKCLRKHTKGFLDCHLMVSNPAQRGRPQGAGPHEGQWIDDYKDAGADMFTFHVEANGDPAETIRKVRAAGMKVGIALKPKTPVEAVLPYVASVDMVLVMTVEPGFGGQSFMADMMPKVRLLRERYPSLDIEVDGGLAPDTIDVAAQAGANVIVAGSSVFKAKDPRATIALLRQSVERCL